MVNKHSKDVKNKGEYSVVNSSMNKSLSTSAMKTVSSNLGGTQRVKANLSVGNFKSRPISIIKEENVTNNDLQISQSVRRSQSNQKGKRPATAYEKIE